MTQKDHQGRRNMLALLGAASATAIAGPALAQLGRGGSAATSGNAPSCIATPEQTEGPYFVDERLNRSDIRADPSDGLLMPGVPLTLQFSVSSVARGGCRPLAGAIVDVWHCDALGMYSDVRERRLSTVGKKFLRGYQTTDAKGNVRFTTIYPGSYPNRAVHIHFKVRTASGSAKTQELTSQLYFDDAITDRVHAQKPYAEKVRRRVRNEEDGIFREGGSQLLLPLVPDGQGYTGRFDIGLRMS
jgi:protocatechuate 3,4-dioxygenase beta subunit